MAAENPLSEGSPAEKRFGCEARLVAGAKWLFEAAGGPGMRFYA
jgi:hypothetical protein